MSPQNVDMRDTLVALAEECLAQEAWEDASSVLQCVILVAPGDREAWRLLNVAESASKPRPDFYFISPTGAVPCRM